ncbi:MAG: HTTM domain-containing protein [Myxococcota bacterium]
MSGASAGRASDAVRRLMTPVDGASLAVFRIGFGLTMLWEVFRAFQLEKIRRYYIRPEYHFPYDFFEWVEPWPGDGMYYHFAVLGVCAAAIAAGFLYRVVAAVFFIGITYVFLLDATRYLNHMYLVCLVSALMVVVPADSAWSLRRLFRGPPAVGVRLWHVALLRAQVGLVYFFGGIAKINGDWLVGVPLREWLSRRSHYPVIGRWLNQESAAYFFSYGGLFFDLLIVPMLMHRRTRLPALVAALAFHLFNAWIFGIGLFPWFMLFATSLFFEPDWPRQVWLAIRQDRAGARRIKLAAIAGVGILPYFILRGNADLPCLAAAMTAALILYGPSVTADDAHTERSRAPVSSRARSAWALGFAATWLLIQMVVPLRHHAVPGDVAWTEEGHRFSWRMKLRTKHSQVVFRVEPAGKEPIVVAPHEELTPKQVITMGGNPVMIRQYAHHLADRYAVDGVRAAVHVRALASLNGRRYRPLIHESFDLAAFEPMPLGHQPWITAIDDPPPMNRRLPRPPRVTFATRAP